MAFDDRDNSMKIGDIVLPDYPGYRLDWRSDWPDYMLGIIVEEIKCNTFIIMSPLGFKEVNLEYLVVII